MDQAMASMWDGKFGSEDYFYGTAPNRFIADSIPLLKEKQRILCMGEGEGRNAVFLASMGFDVTAVDISQVGLAKTKKLAAHEGVTVRTVHADLGIWEADTPYNAIIATYLHLASPLREAVFGKAVSWLTPGGLFIGEFFTKKQLGHNSGGPKDPKLLYSEGEWHHAAASWPVDILTLGETLTHLAEGTGHTGEASVVRVVLKRH